ncbi:metallophosphoesterase [Polymorphospora rubra]|uniref:metallophosphoesterase n=1 Tax=Polymorphospora rubra TaxID=338584 RepID=UPI0033D0911B
MAVIGFAGTIAVVTGLIHLYLWKRLVRDTTRRGRWRRIGTVAALALAVLVPLTLVTSRSGVTWLVWPGYLWLAVMFYLLVVMLVLEIPMLVARLALRRRAAAAPTGPVPTDPATESLIAEPALVGGGAPTEPPAPAAPPVPTPAEAGHDPGRRLLLARGAAIFAGLTATGLTGYGVSTALGPPRIDRVRIPLARLPRAMDGLRIATVSDIHLGPLLGRAHAQRIVDLINGLDADLVAVVGDLVDGPVAELGPAAAPLADLRSRHGSFFVTGNHEYYAGVQEWVAEVDRLGLRVLENERQEIVTPRGVLDLAGVNDPAGEGTGATGGPDFEKALGGRDPQRPVVLLAHQPVMAQEAARYGVDLQLSGHTHGGQIVPFNLLVGLEQPVVSGRGNVDGTEVYVTNGAGFWGPPVRVGAPPQISLVELRSP